jgi:hypothetical protein
MNNLWVLAVFPSDAINDASVISGIPIAADFRRLKRHDCLLDFVFGLRLPLPNAVVGFAGADRCPPD